MLKKYLLLIVNQIAICHYAAGQIECVYCYDQNARISAGVNNLLVNGGFENGTCIPFGQPGSGSFCASSIFYTCDVAGWTSPGGGNDTRAGIYDSASSTIPEGTRAAYFGNGFCDVCSTAPDDTLCLYNTFCTVSGIAPGYPRSGWNNGIFTGVSLQQTVSGLTPGNMYVLEFWAGGNYNNMAFMDNGLFAVDVGLGKTFLRIKPTPPLPDSGVGTRYVIEFIAVSPSHTITFTSWGHICYDCTELVLDDVRLYTPAELSSSVPPCITATNLLEENSEAAVYPNPCTTQLNITITNNERAQLLLYDICSRKVLLQSFVHSVSINTTSLESGIYFYEVKSAGKSVRKGKLVKE